MRAAETYRGARKRMAKARKLVWRALPRLIVGDDGKVRQGLMDGVGRYSSKRPHLVVVE